MSGSGDIIEFNGDRNSFKSTLKQHSKKTIFVKYYATWCGPCKQIHDIVLSQYKKYDNETFICEGIGLTQMDAEHNAAQNYLIKENLL